MTARRVLTGDQEQLAFTLWVRRVPAGNIARQLKCHRNTVSATIRRLLEEAAPERSADLQREREASIAVYLEVQRAAWLGYEEARKRGRSPAMLLGEIRQAQARIDALLDLAPSGPDDPILLLQQFKATVVHLIHAEAPEMAPHLAQRLLAAAERENDDAG